MLTTIAIALLVVAALGGLVIAALAFQGRNIPWLLPIVHGSIAGAGVTLVLASVFRGLMGEGVAAWQGWALAILLVAALGGFWLLTYHLRGQPHPKPVIVVHALVAATGVVVLLAGLMQAGG